MLKKCYSLEKCLNEHEDESVELVGGVNHAYVVVLK